MPITRSQSRLMSARAVVDTAELLEAILLHLPMPEILLARAVSRSWKELVDTSPSLRFATFRPPDTEVLIPLTSRYGVHLSNVLAMPSGATPKHLRINPIFLLESTKHFGYAYWEEQSLVEVFVGHRCEIANLNTLALVENSGLRDMFVTRPACPKASLQLYSRGR